MRVEDKIKGAEEYFDCHERCLFCDIVSQELKKKERVVVENEHFVVITPFAARFPFETWVIPKHHHCDFAEGIQGYEDSLAAIMKGDEASLFIYDSSPVGVDTNSPVDLGLINSNSPVVEANADKNPFDVENISLPGKVEFK